MNETLMRYRPRSLFSSWLALIVVALLLMLAPIASAQSATSTGTASVEIVASPPTAVQPVAIKTDSYTLHLNAATAPKFNINLKAQGGGGTVSPWSGAFFYDVRGHTLDAVVLNKILDLTKNTKLSGFSLYGFAGTTVDKNGKAVAGLSIGKDWKWFDQVSFFTGIGISFSASNPIGGGFIVGASVHF